MPSVTIWNRLEPRSRADGLANGLAARVHDPLWLLARQWQVGEFAGKNAGSPITAQVQWTTAAFDRYAPGAATPQAYDGNAPMEALIEREVVRPRQASTDLLQAAEAGLQFLRFLDAANLGHLRTAYVQQYPLTAPANADNDTLKLNSVVASRALNGIQLRADLASAASGTLPAAPALSTTDATAVLPVANAWATWFDSLFSQPFTPTSWTPARMEYSFALGAAADTNGLLAQEYDGGSVDWYTFDYGTSALAGDTAQPSSATRSVTVAPVTFRGMPARRFWQMEDAAVNIGAMSAAAEDIGRLLLREFALIYGNDWFQIPLAVPYGCQVVINSLSVLDTFGIATTIPHYAALDGSLGGWRMFMIDASGPMIGTANSALAAGNLLVLPPSGLNILDSAAIEDVLMLRDEPAEMAWGIENTVVGASGSPTDRALAWRTTQPAIVPPSANAVAAYRLGSTVPDYWIPFLPVSVDDGPLQLRRGRLPTATTGPEGVFLSYPNQTIFFEELPSEGIHLRRRYRYARGLDGSTWVWIGRVRSIGMGEGRSGLQFDYLDFASSS
jgi:hypothetical protein